MNETSVEQFDIDELETNVTAHRATRPRSRVLERHHARRSVWDRAARWIVALLVIAAVFQEGLATYYDRKMTAAAQAATGRTDLDVRCGRVWDAVLNLEANPGYVEWGSTTAHLHLGVCMNAAGWSDDPLDDDGRVAIMILTHELAHLSGHIDEGETECVAMWAAPQTAVALGRSLEDGRDAARWYARAHNPRLPGEYRAPGCLAGAPPASTLLR